MTTSSTELPAVFVLDNYVGNYVCFSMTGHEVWVLGKNSVAVLSESAGSWSVHQGYLDRNVPTCLGQASAVLFKSGDPTQARTPIEIRQCAASRFPNRCPLAP
jgi:hypothetical protein